MTQQNTFIKLLLPFSIITAVTHNSTTDSLSLNKNLDQVESISVAKKSDNLFEPEYDYTNTSSFRSKSLEESFLTIDKNPEAGSEKKQDLKEIYVYKFKTLMLLAYTFDPKTLTLILLGVHENYYRDLKKYLNK